MPTSNDRRADGTCTLIPALNRTLAVLVVLSTLHAGCGSPRGASRVVDPLGRVAGRMNLSGATDGQWEYRPEASTDYWLVAAPGGTTAAELKRYELPALSWRAAQSAWRAATRSCS